MKIPSRWFVLYQPKYKTPSVFDLHERGLFKTRPPVSKDYGARLIVNEEFRVRMQYVHLTTGDTVDQETGKRYSYINSDSLIDLTENLSLDKEELAGSVSDENVRDEIVRVYDEWYKSYVPLNKEGNIDRAELEKKLISYIIERKKIIGEELIRKNNKWIQPALSRIIFDFNHGLYQRVSDKLYHDYKERGGKDTEQNLIRKILLFYRINESEDPNALLKPDGSKWNNEDEIWNCWVAFAGSESEAKRICLTMESVFRPVSEELSRALLA